MLLNKGLGWLAQQVGNKQMRAAIGHIKNMNEENMRAKAWEMAEQPDVVKTDRVYKPTHTIEFNREGEVLLYSGNPLRDETVYFKYPYIFCTCSVTQMNHWRLSPCSTTC